MKHVFVINSHTTFLSSLGTIDFLGLQKEEIVFLFARNYSNSIYPLNYTIVNIDELTIEADVAFKTDDKYLRRKKIELVDRVVDDFIHDYFALYVSNFGSPVVRLMYTNKRCKKIAFIQEGAMVHETAYENNVPLLKKIRYILSKIKHKKPFRIWLEGCYYRDFYLYKQKKMETYGLDNEIFGGLKAIHHIIKWPIPDIKFDYKTNASFFIFDGMVKNGFCEQNILLRCTERLVAENANTYNYLKFHPNQPEEEVNKMISFFVSRKLPFEILDQSIPFELVLLSMKGLNIYGLASSLCYLAKQLGHNVVCHDDWLFEESKLFQKHIYETGIRLFSDIYK